MLSRFICLPACASVPCLCCVNVVICVSASRRSSNASEKRRGKSSTRSKSPFRSFRFKKNKPAPEATGGHYSDDEDNYNRTIGKPREGDG